MTASASASGDVRLLAASAGGYGTAQGVEVSDAQLDSGSPPDEVDSTSVSDYDVSLTFAFTIAPSGLITGAGKGEYTAVHVHVEGRSRRKGAFACDPPVSGNSFAVVVGGQARGDSAVLSLAIPDAAEHNGDYTCGGAYSGHAARSHIMADSLALVGGGHLEISLARPTSWTLTKTVDSRSTDGSEADAHTWTISTTPGGAPVGIAAGAAAGGSCSLVLTGLAASPSHPLAGQPVIVLFRSSVAVHASLLVSGSGRPATPTDSRNVPAGEDALVWSGWIGDLLPSASHHVELTVEGTACDSTKRLSVALTTR